MVVDGCEGPECFQGMFADVFHELQNIMNFTYKMYMPPDGQWGAKREDGTWTGIIGLTPNSYLFYNIYIVQLCMFQVNWLKRTWLYHQQTSG